MTVLYGHLNEVDFGNCIIIQRMEKKVQAVTGGDREVTAYYGYDPLEKRLYYQSTEEGSLNLTVSSTKLDGRCARKLSRKKGANHTWFSKKFDYFIHKYTLK